MTERYDLATARHYEAYRPPFHRLILDRMINSREAFGSGLDFGCGTGYSAVALAKYCDLVCGVDMSRQMLDLARPHPRITYSAGTVESLIRLPGRPYDIVTFAGSLFYAKSEALRGALLSVCRPGGAIIIYDFEVLMGGLLSGIEMADSPDTSEYDYEVGLEGWGEFEVLADRSERMRVGVSPEEAAHLILSDSFRYDSLQSVLGGADVFENLVSRFRRRPGPISLEANIWYKRYRLARMDPNAQQAGADDA